MNSIAKKCEESSKQYLCLQKMESSEDGFNFVHLWKKVDPEWDLPELVQASKSDCVQLIICDSLIKASQKFKLNVGFFFTTSFCKMKKKVSFLYLETKLLVSLQLVTLSKMHLQSSLVL